MLSKNFVPSNYYVTLFPSVESPTFYGSASISVVILETTSKIILNGKDLKITKSSVSLLRTAKGIDSVSWPKDAVTHRNTQETKSVQYDEKEDLITFEFAHEIPADSHVILHTEFTGIHGDDLNGFYRTQYTDEQGVKKYMVTTQFQSSGCRSCFPSFDQPNLKAVFDITLYVPRNLTCLSNMNIIKEKETIVNDKELKVIKFDSTPVMSTYLVAMCVGEFDYVEAEANPKIEGAKPIKCRVYTPKGKQLEGVFALEVGVKTLEFFSEYFGIAYPLPKCDQIAVPELSFGAMENWGLITYREILILYDKEKSGDQYKRGIATTVCHELAHQWFGNLVTMDWWNDLWLNEGFATFVGTFATDHLFPEWNIFGDFVIEDFGFALELDAERNSHPIEVTVNTPQEVNEVFDGISYSKGASVIRMLEAYLGSDKFSEGVKNYLKKHAYKNTVTNDLWDSLSSVSGFDVKSLMNNWTRQMGYPLIYVNETYNAQDQSVTLKFKQEWFLVSGGLTAQEEAVIWSVPITIYTGNGSVSTYLLDKKEGSVTLPYPADVDFWLINYKSTGFYRVKYSKEHVEKLSSVIVSNVDALTVPDKCLLISNSFALAAAGLSNTSQALTLVSAFVNESNRLVLEQIYDCLEGLKEVWIHHDDIVAAINGIEKTIFSKVIAKYGYEFDPNEDNGISIVRKLAIRACAFAGEQQTIETLRNLYTSYRDGKIPSIHANILEITLVIGMNTSVEIEKDFNYMLMLAKSTNPVEKRFALLALGGVNDPHYVEKILDILLNHDIISSQNIPGPLRGLSTYAPNCLRLNNRELLWKWFTSNWKILHKNYSSTLGLLNQIFSTSARQSTETFLIELRNWAEGKDLTVSAERIKEINGIQRTVHNRISALQVSIAYANRDTDDLKSWMLANLH
ncbi:Aminopeptidase 2 mitochondrial [Boothiomyces sp. JEL0866]|nr:Aminopeptidase 2 mitochondrial [Boothiomyces sp. JEL0866]